MTVDLLEKPLKDLVAWKPTESLSDQYRTPYKYYNPNFDFYGANGIKMNDKGKIVIKKNKSGMIELENRIRAEVIEKINRWQTWPHQIWIQAIKDYTLCTVDRALELKRKKMEWLTNEKQPIIRTYADRVVTGIYKGQYSTKVYPQTKKQRKSTLAIQHFIERCFSTSKTRKTIIDSSTDAVLLWPWFYRTWFKTSKAYLSSRKDVQHDKNYSIWSSYATMDYVSPFNIFGEPHRDFYDQPIIYRNFFPIKKILEEKKEFFILNEDQVALIVNSPCPFSNQNFNKIKLIKYYENLLINNDVGIKESDLYNISISDEMCEYVERWDWSNLAIALNGYIVYDYKNPLATGRHPFKVINYTRMPGTWLGDGIGTLLAWTQKLYDALFNIMFDLAKFTAGPMFLLRPWQAIEGSDGVLDYDPFTFKQLRGDANAKIEVLELPKPDNVNFKMMADILDMANFAISPSSYNQLDGIARSATDSQFRQESLADPIRALAENINETFNETIKDWILEAKEKMPPKFTIWILGKDNKEIFSTINLNDLESNYIFETEFDSIKDLNKTVERKQIVDFLNIINTVGTDPVTQERLIDMRRKFTPYVMSLWNNNIDFELSQDQYYKDILTSEEKKSELQANLQELQQRSQNNVWLLQNIQQAWQDVIASTQDIWTQYKQPEQNPNQQPDSSGNYNANEWIDIDIASIAKSVNQ